MARALVLLLAALPVFGDSYLVTTSAGSGPGSLRQAIEDANSGACVSPCAISFAVTTIDLTSPLPPVRAHGVTIATSGERKVHIRGTAGDGLRLEGADTTTLRGLIFSGFSRHGLVLDRARVTNIEACEVSDNGGNGMLVVDSGGVFVRGSEFSGNAANGVFATRSSGINFTGSLFSSRAHGIALHDTDFAQLTANRVVGNGLTGVLVTGAMRDILIESNVFFENGLLGIDFRGDGPSLDGGPVITSAAFNRGTLRARGVIAAAPDSLVRIQLYSVLDVDATGYGEGLDVIAQQTIRAGADGVASFTIDAPDPLAAQRGRFVTVLATRVSINETGAGTTTEFAQNALVVDEEVKYTVTTLADSGPGSLRDAIELSNRDGQCSPAFPCGIAFAVAGTIQPLSPLPAITRSGIWLEGESKMELDGERCADCNGLEIRGADGTLVRDFRIVGFEGDGVVFSGRSGQLVPSRVDGSFIGMNGRAGVRVEDAVGAVGAVFDNRLGGREATGCVVSGNAGDGIRVVSGHVRAIGNRIGTDATAFEPLPNGGNGIFVSGGAHLERNIIAFNVGDGVRIGASGTTVTASDIHSNGGEGINLVDESVASPAPVIVSARAEGGETRVTFLLDVPPPASVTQSYVVSFFIGSFTDTSGRGEGRHFAGGTFIREPGLKEFVLPADFAGRFITATVTPFDLFAFIPVGTTTEFSNAIQATSGSCPTTAPMLLPPSGPITFRWSAVGGATEYRVWTMKFGDQPRLVFRGTATEAAPALEPGTYDWVVEARFEGCHGTQSEHRIITVP